MKTLHEGAAMLDDGIPLWFVLTAVMRTAVGCAAMAIGGDGGIAMSKQGTAAPCGPQGLAGTEMGGASTPIMAVRSFVAPVAGLALALAG